MAEKDIEEKLNQIRRDKERLIEHLVNNQTNITQLMQILARERVPDHQRGKLESLEKMIYKILIPLLLLLLTIILGGTLTAKFIRAMLWI